MAAEIMQDIGLIVMFVGGFLFGWLACIRAFKRQQQVDRLRRQQRIDAERARTDWRNAPIGVDFYGCIDHRTGQAFRISSPPATKRR